MFSSSVRDLLVSRCSLVLSTAVILFHRILGLRNKLIEATTTSSNSSLPSFSSSESISLTPCESLTELQRGPTPKHQSESLISKECLSADISDGALLAVLDYAFHATKSSTVSSDSEEQKVPAAFCPFPDFLRSALNVASGDRSIVVLVSGASGCGKSTLSCLLANRLGLGTVLSTDTIRHILRSVYSKNDNPLLYASTYETGKFISEEALHNHRSTIDNTDVVIAGVLERRRCIEGYLQQSEMLYDRLEFIITQLMANGESLVVEGMAIIILIS